MPANLCLFIAALSGRTPKARRKHIYVRVLKSQKTRKETVLDLIHTIAKVVATY